MITMPANWRALTESDVPIQRQRKDASQDRIDRQESG
jgi:hypothetical protein